MILGFGDDLSFEQMSLLNAFTDSLRFGEDDLETMECAREFSKSLDKEPNDFSWLTIKWGRSTDHGHCDNAYVKTDISHPALSCARYKALRGLRILSQMGSPLLLNHYGSAPVHVAKVASKNQTKGAFDILFKCASSNAEKEQCVMSWLSGCVSSLWSEGVRECSSEIKNILSRKAQLPETDWETFHSPMDALMWQDASRDDPENAEKTFRAMLEAAPLDAWPIQIEHQESYTDHITGMAQSGAWWSVKTLVEFLGEDCIEKLKEAVPEALEQNLKDSEEDRERFVSEVEGILFDGQSVPGIKKTKSRI